jgi:putative hydrolase of HD superfamily
MKEVVYGLMPETWHEEMKMFTENEFSSIVTIGDKQVKKTSEEITKRFNDDSYNPRDGQIIEAVDKLAAFSEAYLALKNGIDVQEFWEAKIDIKNKYTGIMIAGLNFGEIYADFE